MVLDRIADAKSSKCDIFSKSRSVSANDARLSNFAVRISSTHCAQGRHHRRQFKKMLTMVSVGLPAASLWK